MKDFNHIEHWIFDLDNTLYPPSYGVLEQIDENVVHYVKDTIGISYEEALVVNDRYVKTYGGSVAGLFKEHKIDPEHFILKVLEIDQSVIKPIDGLEAFLKALPGQKIIFTNSHHTFARDVLEKMELSHIFDAIFDISAANYVPKPHDATYAKIIDDLNINPHQAIFFEDSPRNLAPAHRLGMKTVLLGPNLDREIVSQDYIHSDAPDLLSWFKGRTLLEKAS